MALSAFRFGRARNWNCVNVAQREQRKNWLITRRISGSFNPERALAILFKKKTENLRTAETAPVVAFVPWYWERLFCALFGGGQIFSGYFPSFSPCLFSRACSFRIDNGILLAVTVLVSRHVFLHNKSGFFRMRDSTPFWVLFTKQNIVFFLVTSTSCEVSSFHWSCALDIGFPQKWCFHREWS